LICRSSFIHGDSDFVWIDTEWSQASWGCGPDGYITEFGAAEMPKTRYTVLVTGLQPIPLPGPENKNEKLSPKTKNKS
jgi:hypothetical protein